MTFVQAQVIRRVRDGIGVVLSEAGLHGARIPGSRFRGHQTWRKAC